MKDQKKTAPRATAETGSGNQTLTLALIGLGVACAFAFGMLAGQRMAKPKANAPATSAQISQASIDSIKSAIVEANGKQLEATVGQIKDIAFSERLSLDSGLPLTLLDIPATSAIPARGPVDAPITLIEFSDFQCPYCSKMAAALDQVMAQNPGKIRLLFVDRPLTVDRGGYPFHPYAYIAHEAAAAAGAQGKFWEMYDYIFKNQQNIFPAQPSSQEDYTAKQAEFRTKLVTAAGTMGLDTAKFKSDLESHAQKARLDQTVAISDSLNINSTPTVMTGAYFKMQDPGLATRLLGAIKKIE